MEGRGSAEANFTDANVASDAELGGTSSASSAFCFQSRRARMCAHYLLMLRRMPAQTWVDYPKN